MQRRVIAVAANFTTEPVGESLGFWLRGFGLPCDMEHAPFDQVFQQLLDPSSLLGGNRAGANAILLRLDLWLDSLDGPEGEERTGAFERKLEEIATALVAACSRSKVPHVVVSCPADPRRLREPGTAALLEREERALTEALRDTPNLRLITSDELLAAHGSPDYFDAESDALGKIPFTESMFATIGTLVARRVRAALGVPFKVVVLDCDNTLWRGVLGEAGPHGIELDEAYTALQRFFVRQHDEGMLVCLCSKNEEADVREAFRLRPEMPLTWAHVTSARINWEPKSANLRALAAELDLGLSSFVFVDDSPYEIAEVRRDCPEVLGLQLPTDPAGIRRFIEQGWIFDRTSVTDADRKRAASYAQNARRSEIRRQATSLDDFLRDLDLRIAITTPTGDALERAAQMTLRTNQFNFSTVRRTVAELSAALSSGGGSLQARIIDVRDRFGDYGIVGLMLFETRGDTMRVDTFLLSCRALGRRVEHHMLAHLGELAREAGATRIEMPFVRSPRNTPALRFLTSVTHDPSVTGDKLFVVTPQEACDALSLAASDAGEDATESASDASASSEKSATVDADLVWRLHSTLHDPAQLVAALHAARPVEQRSSERPIVAPRNEIESALAEIWKSVLHVDQLGVTDDFFDLGGNSLAAVPMFARLRKQFGSTLSPTVLFDAPTIELLARRLSGGAPAEAFTSLLRIQSGGERRPLFLVHAGAGTILIYRHLATALGSDQPVYGLQVQGLYSKDRPHWTIEGMAEHYAREIRAVQPSGPYQLAGFCLGATIAFEIALQLERAGEEVTFLGSFDGPAPGYRGGERRSAVKEDAVRRLSYRVERKLTQWRNRILLRYTNRRGAPVPLVFRRTSWYFTVNNLFAKLRYSASEKFAGRMHVFTIKDRFKDPTIGWGQWCAGGAVPHEIAGAFQKHRDLMRPPMVDTLASAVAPVLDGQAPSRRLDMESARPIAIYRESGDATGKGEDTSRRDRPTTDVRRLDDTRDREITPRN